MAFKTNIGLFEPTVMFFGLCNSLATFQAMMNDILKDELNDGWVIVYMDDILIYSKTKEGLEEMTKRVLQWLCENDLYLKPGKYKFCKTRIEYLGLIIEEGKMSMDPGKLNTSSYHCILYTQGKCLHRHLFPAMRVKDIDMVWQPILCYWPSYVNSCHILFHCCPRMIF